MQRLSSGEDALARLDRMEGQYYGLQLRLYDIQAEILQCEELLLTAQLDSIRRQMTGGGVWVCVRVCVRDPDAPSCDAKWVLVGDGFTRHSNGNHGNGGKI